MEDRDHAGRTPDFGTATAVAPVLLCCELGDVSGFARLLDALAVSLAALDQPERAVRLHEAASALGEAVSAQVERTGVETGDEANAAGGPAGRAGFAVMRQEGGGLRADAALSRARSMATDPAGPRGALTQRELVVLRLLAERRTDKEIAAALGISHRTVMGHVGRILTKLGVRSRREAVDRAVAAGFAERPLRSMDTGR